MLKLSELSPVKGSTKSRKRVGRGVGSGHGKTSCRGSNGQNSRSGGGVRPGFEGGQMPIHRRLPKRGFANIFKKRVALININDLGRFDAGIQVDEILLRKEGLVKGSFDLIKLLSTGEISKPLTLKINKISKAAKDKIESAGGVVEVIQ